MVKINDLCLGIYHRVTANKKVKEMNKGDMKDVLIQKRTDGRFCVMGVFIMMPPPQKPFVDMFYFICKDESELHDTFTEQFTNLTNFSKG